MTGSEIEFPVEGGVPAGLDFGGTGPGVLLVHGSGHNAAAWADVAARLTGHCHPVAVDLRGHGRTRVGSGDPERYWRDLGDVVTALAWERPVLVGQRTAGGGADDGPHLGAVIAALVRGRSPAPDGAG